MAAAAGLPVHHQLPEFTQTHVHRVGDTIQPSHPLSSPSPPAPSPSQHQVKTDNAHKVHSTMSGTCRNSMQVRYSYYLKCKVHYNLQSIPTDMEQREERTWLRQRRNNPRVIRDQGKVSVSATRVKQYFRKTAESTSNAIMIEKIINS